MPKIAVDIIAIREGKLVLVERAHEPFGFALPGGLVEEGETLERAASRELEEETSLSAHSLEQFQSYSDPNRDPRGHVITTVFSCEAKGDPQPGSDAASIVEATPEEIERLKKQFAFDHYRIIQDFLKKHPEKLD